MKKELDMFTLDFSAVKLFFSDLFVFCCPGCRTAFGWPGVVV